MNDVTTPSSAVLSELQRVCASYRDRFGEWPAQVRVDAARMQSLATDCTPEGFAALAAHVRLGVRDSSGVSAGGRGIVQLEGAPSQSSLALAQMWLAAVEIRGQQAIESNVSYWQEAARRTLEAFPHERTLDAEHFVRAQQLGPDELVSDDREQRRAELLFYAVYLASFGIHGVHPKALAVAQYSYGWQPNEFPNLALMLHRENTIRFGNPPWEALDALAATRDDFESAAVRFGQTMTELARDLAGR